jgi:hypothetical protein
LCVSSTFPPISHLVPTARQPRPGPSLTVFMISVLLLSTSAAGALLPSSPANSPTPASSGGLSRRSVLAHSAAATVAALATPVLAVNFDPDRYGDKELKTATINKVTQNIRNELAKDLSLLVPVVQLAISDALSYSEDGTGGIDGSILYEMDRPSSAGLEKAVALVKKIHSDLQRVTEISYADVIAFAGATAIQSVGGPKVTVQLGRADAKAAEPEGSRAGFSWNEPTLGGLRTLGKGAKLTDAEIVALVGALGTLELAARPMPAFLDDGLGDEDEDIDADGKAAAAEVGGGSADVMYGKVNKKGPKYGDANYDRDQKLAVDVRVQKIGNQCAVLLPAVLLPALLHADEALPALALASGPRPPPPPPSLRPRSVRLAPRHPSAMLSA